MDQLTQDHDPKTPPTPEKVMSYKLATIKLITRNLKKFLNDEYLDSDELLFLFELTWYAESKNNLLHVHHMIGKGRYTDNELITLFNKFISKGLIFVVINDPSVMNKQLISDGKMIEGITLYLNPEVAYNGNTYQIPAELCELNSKYDFIEKRGLELPWKVRYKSGDKFGCLCHREGYLKEKNLFLKQQQTDPK